MTTKLSKKSYEQLIQEDLEWLDKQPDTLENHHIGDIVKDSVNFYYPESTKETPKKIVSNGTWKDTLKPKWRDNNETYDRVEYNDRDY